MLTDQQNMYKKNPSSTEAKLHLLLAFWFFWGVFLVTFLFDWVKHTDGKYQSVDSSWKPQESQH